MEYKRNLRLGVEGYTDDELSLDVYGNVNVSGNISIAGTVTYDDVTNVDSIGLVTARSGIDIGYPGTATTLTADGNAVFSGIVTAAAFFGDGSGLDGVTGVNIVAQEATGDPVYPTFASNVGVTTLGIAQTGFVYVPSTGNVGIGSTQPASTLVVNAPSGYTGNILDVQLAGSTAFQVKSVGSGWQPINITGSNGALFQANNTSVFTIHPSQGLQITSGPLSFAPFFAKNIGDVQLYRDAANTLAQRNAGIGQTFRIYNTYTSATNFERGQVGWSTNVFIVGTEKGSSIGTARPMHFQTDGTTRVAITTDGYVGIKSTTPIATLDVNGDVNITGIVTATKFVGQIEVDIINPFLLMGA